VGIYVETLIRAPLELLWRHTQRPDLHERWDLRFTDIDELPGYADGSLKRFRYTTRMGFGLSISGEGETVGERDLPNGSRASSLRFGSASPLSLIREGSGYWKYEPTGDGVRFVTAYDYRTRYGFAGALVDRLVFRPLMGWATAWSFDRLRLWIERGIPPDVARRQAQTHLVARSALAGIFLWQGVVPKLLGSNVDERSMLAAAGVPEGFVPVAVALAGIGELLLAGFLAIQWHQRWPALGAAAVAAASSLVVALTSPGVVGAAFNPITLSLAVVALAAVDIVGLDGAPSAGRCLRHPPLKTEP